MAPINRGSGWDRFWARVAPRWSLERTKARIAFQHVRNFEAASRERRTSGWTRATGDVNSVNGSALSDLRMHARDLARNSGWGKRGLQAIANNTIGWGMMARPFDAPSRAAKVSRKLWKEWARSKRCDFDGRMNFYGLQKQVIRSIAEAGEVLIQRYLFADGTMQIRLLEADHLDTNKDGTTTAQGGFMIQGVEFDSLGRRVAYWIFPKHPGSDYSSGTIKSVRVPATDILHVFEVVRPGQVRGISWFAASIVVFKELDEFEDATLMKQKIAALFTGFITDTTGTAPLLGQAVSGVSNGEAFEPGMMTRLTPGQDVKFSDPPSANDHESFSRASLRKAAAGLGVTYEDLTGDYTGVNFSSARMGRIAHQANVDDWRWNMMVPGFLDPVWNWVMETAQLKGQLPEIPSAEWTARPMPSIDPDKEALALIRRVRSGEITHDEMLREQGIEDPEEHWQRYADRVKSLKALGVVLDTDASATTQAGNPRDQAKQEPVQDASEADVDSETARKAELILATRGVE